MPNGTSSNPMQTIYRALVIILLSIASFIAAQIYGKVDSFPKEYTPLTRFEATQNKIEELPTKYVTLERYKCDVEKIDKGIEALNKKFDRYISKHEE